MAGFRKVEAPAAEFDFLTFEDLERLLEVVKDGSERYALFLMGAEAGVGRRRLRHPHDHGVWRGISDTPKGWQVTPRSR